ncbi:unnamed protein product [Brassica rapa]|uniref:Uncharacterized protein n=1 Tax=Brassica campestris TaxID=3711 RepID=A0A8D9CUS1_BRACM|nr:unnamed protein product [Brassica rapa]
MYKQTGPIFPTVHCRRTESPVLRDLEGLTTLTTALELEVQFIPTLEAARPSLVAGATTPKELRFPHSEFPPKAKSAVMVFIKDGD